MSCFFRGFLFCPAGFTSADRGNGGRLLVKGAARHVWASGMSRSMGGGIKAYQLEKGVASSLDRMVNIFEPADEAEVGTVAEQEAFYSDWLTSR